MVAAAESFIAAAGFAADATAGPGAGTALGRWFRRSRRSAGAVVATPGRVSVQSSAGLSAPARWSPDFDLGGSGVRG
ncbi:hypothetical protein C8259_34635 [Nocardia nova]|uniref:Uncharacterized protein n=1 Tax=Nocardia nova TaxID=37330 RepID=A0A2T2YPU1_9NOCA|nr:hypothetical protein C8259_34635 [Nocardia nova]